VGLLEVNPGPGALLAERGDVRFFTAIAAKTANPEMKAANAMRKAIAYRPWFPPRPDPHISIWLKLEMPMVRPATTSSNACRQS
jgi:hypothetical protein